MTREVIACGRSYQDEQVHLWLGEASSRPRVLTAAFCTAVVFAITLYGRHVTSRTPDSRPHLIAL